MGEMANNKEIKIISYKTIDKKYRITHCDASQLDAKYDEIVTRGGKVIGIHDKE